MDTNPLTRREAIRKAVLAGALLAGGSSAVRADDLPAQGGPPRAKTLHLGIATYSLRKLSVDDMLSALVLLDVQSASAFRVHLPILLGTPPDCAAIAKKFADAGVALVSTGVVQLDNSEAVMRRAFECGRAAGLTTMTASYARPPDRETFLLTEKFVQEYDIRLAFHNHGPEDSIFPSPYDVWKAVQPYDPRLGLCLDVGHARRAGVNPTEAIYGCHQRLYDLHLKDSIADIGAKTDIPVILGHGQIHVRSIMETLLDVGYAGQVGLEYEGDEANPIPAVAQCFGYMRGMLDALHPR